MRIPRKLFVLLSMAATPALAQQGAPPAPPPATSVAPSALGLFVYPQKAQDAAQQQKDEAECYQWAQKQTGIDPMAPPPSAPPPAAKGPDGSAVRGAARGAARGAVVGEVADDDASEGAAAGAAVGAVRGRRKGKQQKAAAAQQAQATQQAQGQATKDTFKKAWSTCLDGRGYSVK